MRDDELLGYTPPRKDEEDSNGCFGIMVGCLVMLILMGIVTTITWLLWPKGGTP